MMHLLAYFDARKNGNINGLDGITLMEESTGRKHTDELLQVEVKLVGHGEGNLKLRANFTRK